MTVSEMVFLSSWFILNGHVYDPGTSFTMQDILYAVGGITATVFLYNLYRSQSVSYSYSKFAISLLNNIPDRSMCVDWSPLWMDDH